VGAGGSRARATSARPRLSGLSASSTRHAGRSDGEKPALWLKSISHTGKANGLPAVTLPSVRFEGTKFPNRVDTVDGLGPLLRYRITGVVSESGGVTTVAGCIWGSAGILFYSPDAMVAQVYLCLILFAIAAMTMPALSMFAPAYYPLVVLLLLPFIVPTVLSTVAWLWMLDPAFSVVNRLMVALGWPKPGPSWLGDPTLAMVSIIIINTWRGLPFYGITLLAGLQTVPSELYEAASIDGAGGWERFRFITLPLLRPIILIVTLFSVIFTFADFQLIYVLTHGGPANATQLFATYAFDIAMGAGQLGLGASIALAMLPALALLIVALTIYLRRE